MKTQIVKSTLVVALMTSLSRSLGLIRDIVIAVLFGASATIGVDAFIVAFRIPNFLRRLFAEGGFSQAFVPVLTEYKETRTEEDVKALVDQTSATLGLYLTLTTVVGVIAAPAIVSVFAIGWWFSDAPDDMAKLSLASDMLRITFPYLLLISLTAFAGSILNTYRRFAVPAFTPVLLNVSLISCAIWWSPEFPEQQRIMALAWGVLIAGIVQLLFQFPFLSRLGLIPKPGLNRDREGVKRILKLLLPVLFALSVTQINLLVDIIIASFLTTGSISWLYFSDRMVEFPLGVFGIALSTVILPTLSAKYATEDTDSFNATLEWAVRWVFMIALPAAMGLILLAGPILSTIFQYQAFTAYDVEMSSLSLMAYALGLPGFILIKVFSAGFFSRQDTRTPVKISVIAMISNIILNLILVGPLDHAGLALATSLSAYINAGLLYRALKHDRQFHTAAGWLSYLMKLSAGLMAMAVILTRYVPDMALWSDWTSVMRVQTLAIWIIVGASCYFILIRILGIRPIQMTAQP